MKNIAPAIAALLTLGPLGLAIASTAVSGQPGIEHVRVRATPVRTAADARRLDRRLADAALDVCGASSQSLAEVRSAVARSACYADALGRARTDAAAAGTMTGTP